MRTPSIRWLLVPVLAALIATPLPVLADEEEQLPETRRFFEELDRNRDGVVTRDEFQGSSAAFRLLDDDKDGQITAPELGLPADYRPKPAPNQAAGPMGRPGRDRRVGGEFLQRMLERLRRMDTDGDGRITREEYTGPDALFDRMDRNQDGVIDARDVGGDAPAGGSSVAPTTPGTASDAPQLPERLRGADTNGDGKVSRDEWRGRPEIFDRLDRNRDGALTGSDFGAPETPRITPEQIKARFTSLDKDGDGALAAGELPERFLAQMDSDSDGRVTFDEFEQAVKRRLAADAEKPAEETAPAEPERRNRRVVTPRLLRRYDNDRNGEVSRDEFPLSDERFQELDANGDGVLSEADIEAAEGMGGD